MVEKTCFFIATKKKQFFSAHEKVAIQNKLFGLSHTRLKITLFVAYLAIKEQFKVTFVHGIEKIKHNRKCVSILGELKIAYTFL